MVVSEDPDPVFVSVVEVKGVGRFKEMVSGVLGVAVEMFLQVPSLLGWQFVHGFPVFTQTQPLHEPDLLHLQHAIALQLFHSSFCSLVVKSVISN